MSGPAQPWGGRGSNAGLSAGGGASGGGGAGCCGDEEDVVFSLMAQIPEIEHLKERLDKAQLHAEDQQEEIKTLKLALRDQTGEVTAGLLARQEQQLQEAWAARDAAEERLAALQKRLAQGEGNVLGYGSALVQELQDELSAKGEQLEQQQKLLEQQQEQLEQQQKLREQQQKQLEEQQQQQEQLEQQQKHQEQQQQQHTQALVALQRQKRVLEPQLARACERADTAERDAVELRASLHQCQEALHKSQLEHQEALAQAQAQVQQLQQEIKDAREALSAASAVEADLRAHVRSLTEQGEALTTQVSEQEAALAEGALLQERMEEQFHEWEGARRHQEGMAEVQRQQLSSLQEQLTTETEARAAAEQALTRAREELKQQTDSAKALTSFHDSVLKITIPDRRAAKAGHLLKPRTKTDFRCALCSRVRHNVMWKCGSCQDMVCMECIPGIAK